MLGLALAQFALTPPPRPSPRQARPPGASRLGGEEITWTTCDNNGPCTNREAEGANFKCTNNGYCNCGDATNCWCDGNNGHCDCGAASRCMCDSNNGYCACPRSGSKCTTIPSSSTTTTSSSSATSPRNSPQTRTSRARAPATMATAMTTSYAAELPTTATTARRWWSVDTFRSCFRPSSSRPSSASASSPSWRAMVIAAAAPVAPSRAMDQQQGSISSSPGRSPSRCQSMRTRRRAPSPCRPARCPSPFPSARARRRRRARRRALVAGRRPRRNHARRRRVRRQQPGCRRVGPADGRGHGARVVVGPVRGKKI